MKKWKAIVAGAILLSIVIAGVIVLANEVLDRAKEAYIQSLPRATPVPSSDRPDIIRLTWSGNPRVSQAVQWRTGPDALAGVVQCRPKDQTEGAAMEVIAEKVVVEDPLIENDPVNLHFSAVLTDLTPGVLYTYRVGDPEKDIWSEWYEFTTAPSGEPSFSFIYLGDAQTQFEPWGRLLRHAMEHRPEAAFVVIAGDLVNRGNDRDDWDDFLNAARGVFDRVPLVPAIGNHECSKGADPRLYLDLLTLPENGPETIPPERAYSLRYSNALFVVLDSNLPPQDQRAWLERELSETDAAWKFVIFHHPVYSSKPNRDNPEIRAHWSDLFDKYHVDMALQGHDHAYLRTYPMRDGQVVESPADGTIYVISVSGSKFYEFDPREIAAVAFGQTSTYQIIDLDSSDPATLVLTYRAYDMNGDLRDEVVIRKPAEKQS